MDPKLAYTINEAATRASVSRSFMYNEWAAGRGPRSFYCGRSRRISAKALDEWINSLEAAAGAKR